MDADGVAANYSANSFDATDESLDAYYTFEGNADDITSNGHDGTLTNGATTISVPNVTDSFSSDPFAAGGATYNIDGTTSASIEIQDSGSYTPGIVIVDEYGDEVTAENPLVEDANGDVTFSVKLTSEPTENVTLTVDSSNNSFSTDTWDEWQEFTVPANTAISVASNDADYSSLTPVIYTTDSSDTIKLKTTEGGEIAELVSESAADSQSNTTDEDAGGAGTNGFPELVTADSDIISGLNGGVFGGTGTTTTTSSVNGSDDSSDTDSSTTDSTTDTITETVTKEVELARFASVSSLDLTNSAIALLDIGLTQYVTDDSGQQLASFDVALAQQPKSDVSITFNDDSNTVVNFTADNWNETQKVTIVEASDIQATTTSSDSDYDNQTLDLPVVTTDVDLSFNSSTYSLITSEDGDSAEFGVRLSAEPSDDVTVTMTIGDTEEGTFADGSSEQIITITPENWDDYQRVTVVGINDTQFDGDTEHYVDFAVTSNDSDYTGFAISPLSITNQDNESSDIDGNVIANFGDVKASLSVTTNATITEGETGKYTVTLSQAPTEDTVVQYQVISNSATSGEDFTALTGEVTVEANKTTATIDLASLDDFIDEDSETVEIQLVSPFTNVELEVDTAYSYTENTVGLKLATGTEDIQISPWRRACL